MWVAPLVPGKYDVIIDMDGDGKYTLGTDYIDAGLTARGRQEVNAGFIVTGTFPPLRLALSAIPPVINAGERSTIFAQLQTDAGQFISGATVNFSIVGQGGQLSANSGTTNQNGIATVNLTATQANTTLTVQGSVTHAGQSAQEQVSVRVRAPGELGLTIRQR